MTNYVQLFSRQYKVGPGVKNAWPALHQWGICSGLFAPRAGINAGLQVGTNLTASQTRSLFISLSLYLSKMVVRICYYEVFLMMTRNPVLEKSRRFLECFSLWNSDRSRQGGIHPGARGYPLDPKCREHYRMTLLPSYLRIFNTDYSYGTGVGPRVPPRFSTSRLRKPSTSQRRSPGLPSPSMYRAIVDMIVLSSSSCSRMNVVLSIL